MQKKEIRDRYIPFLKNVARCVTLFFFLICCVGSIFAQGRAITGVIVDSKGETIIGANVVVKGTTNGTISDVNGRFSLQVSNNDVLQVSFVGYVSKEIPVGNNTSLNITLEDDEALLEEVVVVGYGVQRKLSVTNAISSVGSNEITERTATDVNQALQGKLPGLTILDKGGAPGDQSFTLRVRGVTSLNDNTPLILIDGVPGNLALLNPIDIESVSVLKDAASAAIYGSRAAAGVILVTTKRSSEGRLSVSYNGYFGIARSNNNAEHMGTVDYMIHQNWAYLNTYGYQKYTDEEIRNWPANHARDPEQYPEPNTWREAMFKLAPQHSHTITMNGGTERFSTRLSLRYQDQGGIIDNYNFSVSELRARNEFKPSSKLTFSSNINVRLSARETPNTTRSPFYNMWQNSQWAVPRYKDGSYGLSEESWSPLIVVYEAGYMRQKGTFLSGIFRGEYKIIDAITLAAQYSTQINYNNRVSFQNAYDYIDKLHPERRMLNTINNLTDYRTHSQEDGIDLQLLFNKRFGNHALSGMLGYSEIHNQGDWLQGYRRNFYNNDLDALSMGIADATQIATGGINGSNYPASEWGLRSYFARVNYDYNNKYLLEANIRYDGSSRFAKGHQYGTFPSFSVGWIISNEGFWKSVPIDYLKLRGSWGQVGSQQVGLFTYMKTYVQSNYVFNEQLATGYRITTLADENISWETTTQTNFGLDTYLFNNKINIALDWYKKRTTDILLQVPIPRIMGLNATNQNAGIVENMGVELQLGARKRFSDFDVEFGLNLAYNKNKVIDLAGTGPHISTTGDTDFRTITTEGYPINSYYGYQVAGMFQTQEEVDNYAKWDASVGPGDLKYVDQNGDGLLSPADFVIMGKELPDLTFSSNWSVGWKGLKLDLFWQGTAISNRVMTGMILEHGIWAAFTHKYWAEDYWTPDNPNARDPRPTKLTMKNAQISSWSQLNGNYFRLKNVKLSYDIPKKICNRLNIAAINVYLSATNLLTFSELNKYNIDPEQERREMENSYPQTSVTTFGLNINF